MKTELGQALVLPHTYVEEGRADRGAEWDVDTQPPPPPKQGLILGELEARRDRRMTVPVA